MSIFISNIHKLEKLASGWRWLMFLQSLHKLLFRDNDLNNEIDIGDDGDVVHHAVKILPQMTFFAVELLWKFANKLHELWF